MPDEPGLLARGQLSPVVAKTRIGRGCEHVLKLIVQGLQVKQAPLWRWEAYGIALKGQPWGKSAKHTFPGNRAHWFVP